MNTKLPERYVYPAVLTFYGPGKEIAVDFPDLGVATSGVDEADALFSAKECLQLAMFGREEDGEDIPTPTPITEVKTEDGEVVILVDAYMPSVRMAQRNKAVSRTVTLPAWMNALAMERGINFSQVLQDALRARIQG